MSALLVLFVGGGLRDATTSNGSPGKFSPTVCPLVSIVALDSEIEAATSLGGLGAHTHTPQ